jgi:hypothetical protein
VTEHGYLEVKNFDQFQHYKQRNPPWIKLHSAMMDDYEFAQLPEVARFHLMGIWVLASKTGNKIPADPEWIARRINAQSPVDIELLVSSGFVRRLRRASDALAEPKQVAIPSRVEERRDRVEENTLATPTGDARLGELTRGQLLGLVRKCCAPRRGKTPEAEMVTNASVVDTIAGRGWTYARIGHAVVGTQLRRDRGEIGCIPAGAGWTLKYLLDATPDVDPFQVGLNAYHEAAKPPPEEKRKGSTAAIGDVLDFTKFAREAG